MSESDAAISVRGLTLRAGDEVLLSDAALQVESGELCLLVGASGTGKSLTLALLSGLLAPGGGVRAEAEEARVLGHDAMRLGRESGLPGTSIVFQDFALLDDVDARGNVLFGIDHGTPFADGTSIGSREARIRFADGLLQEFGLPSKRFPAQMSGGMKQRLAVARALAFGPRLLFYDEPTSGLDPAMSLEVARRIREAHDHHGMTSLVVTHDLLSLKDIADRIILLDPREKRLREVPKADVDRALAELAGFRAPEPPEQPPLPWGARMLDAVRRGTIRFLDGTGTFVLGAARTCVHLVPRYPATRWGLRFLWHFTRLGTLGTAIPFIALAGLIAGFITTFFMFGLLPLQGYTEPVLVEEFIGSLGYALYRVVVPVVTTLLFASRTGAAIAADIGNRVLTRQVDAMRSHGIPPSRYLLTGLGLSCLAGIPLLFFLSYETARLAAVAVFLATHPGHGPFAFNQEFLSLVGEGWGPFPGGTGYVLGKLLISALGTAGIAYHVGMRPKASGAAVASGVTSAIIRTTVFVLTVHLVFALFEF